MAKLEGNQAPRGQATSATARALRRVMVAGVALLAISVSAGCGRRDEGGGPDNGPKGKPPAPIENRVELASLVSTAGRLPDDVGLWETQPLQGRMQAMLEERYPVFLASMTEAKPIEAIDGLLLVRGSASLRADADADADRALVVIDPKGDQLYLWARIEGEVVERKGKDGAPNLPAAARDWIEGR